MDTCVDSRPHFCAALCCDFCYRFCTEEELRLTGFLKRKLIPFERSWPGQLVLARTTCRNQWRGGSKECPPEPIEAEDVRRSTRKWKQSIVAAAAERGGTKKTASTSTPTSTAPLRTCWPRVLLAARPRRRIHSRREAQYPVPRWTNQRRPRPRLGMGRFQLGPSDDLEEGGRTTDREATLLANMAKMIKNMEASMAPNNGSSNDRDVRGSSI